MSLRSKLPRVAGIVALVIAGAAMINAITEQ
jgi:hypothetical protein